MSAPLVDGLDSAGGEFEGDSLLKLWHVDALLLEVRVLAYHAGRVELGSTGPIGVAASFH